MRPSVYDTFGTIELSVERLSGEVLETFENVSCRNI